MAELKFEPRACAWGSTERRVVEERVKGGVTGLGVLLLWGLVHVFLSLDSSICEMEIQAPLSSGEM